MHISSSLRPILLAILVLLLASLFLEITLPAPSWSRTCGGADCDGVHQALVAAADASYFKQLRVGGQVSVGVFVVLSAIALLQRSWRQAIWSCCMAVGFAVLPSIQQRIYEYGSRDPGAGVSLGLVLTVALMLLVTRAKSAQVPRRTAIADTTAN